MIKKDISSFLKSRDYSGRGYLEEDIWRVENDWFGIKYFPSFNTGAAFFAGIRSGLEVLRLIDRYNDEIDFNIYIYDEDFILKKEIYFIISIFFPCSKDFVKFIDKPPKEEKIGFIRIEKQFFKKNIVYPR